MTRIFRYEVRRAGIIWQLALVLTIAGMAEAQERQYLIGPSVDLVAGSDSNPVSSIPSGLPATSVTPASFFRFYPAISLATSGGHSSLRASYAVELAGTRGETNYDSMSHGASLAFSYPATSKWKLNLTDSFLATSDAASFNGFRGASPAPDQFRFLLDPVALRLSTRSNTSGITAEHTLDPRSTLLLAATHSLRYYEKGTTVNPGLSNQQFVTGSIGYTRKTDARDSWSVGYTGSYFSFENFASVASQNAHVGYSLGLTPDVTLELTVGASRVGSLGSAGNTGNVPTLATYVGYNTSVSISKTKQNDSFSVHYHQETGQPSGLGSVSDIRRAGVAVEHKVGTVALFVDSSVFDTQDRVVNTLHLRGVSAMASAGIPLTETLSIHGGAEYQRYDQTTPFAFSRQRLFVTLRYNQPKLWTIFR